MTKLKQGVDVVIDHDRSVVAAARTMKDDIATIKTQLPIARLQEIVMGLIVGRRNDGNQHLVNDAIALANFSHTASFCLNLEALGHIPHRKG